MSAGVDHRTIRGCRGGDCRSGRSRRSRLSVPLRWLTRFTHDDTGYLRWLAANPRGCVLNCAHQPRADYLKLHRTDCPPLRRAGMTNLTGAYTKVCGPSATAINEWLQATLAATADRCPVCFR